MREIVKYVFNRVGIKSADLLHPIFLKSIKRAAVEQKLKDYVSKLSFIVPDISNQYTIAKIEGLYAEVKSRTQQAFQMRLFERAIRLQSKKRMNIVDIGDSAGTHLIYIKDLCKDISFRTISVNLNKESVERIRAKGMEAIHCSAEDLDLGDEDIDMFVTFQMVEHLMNPCLFFRRLAVRGKSEYLVVTVPYRKRSSVGLWTYRPLIQALKENQQDLSAYSDILSKTKNAEDEHVFELSPIDWKLLMLFSGWRPIYDEVYLQYPRRHILYFTKPLWRKIDFEGFWGVILKRDLSFSNIYKDWPN
jgi:SAM-dependent methyltransferase